MSTSSTRMESNFVPEPERHEFRSGAMHHFELPRRAFFQIFGAGIAVFTIARGSASAQESGARAGRNEGIPKNISSWIHIAEDGRVTAFTGKVEIGQNIRTSLAQSVADELRVPFESVRMVMGDTELTPYDMGTFGSRTTPYMTPQLRAAASAARDLLLEAAGNEWNVSPGALVAAAGKVTDPVSGRSLSYANLATGKTLAHDLPETDPVTPPAEWTVAGQSIPKVDARDFVTGRHKYTTDLRPSGLLYGKVLRPYGFGATLASADLSAAQAMPGVVVVRDGNFVGAAAPTERDAMVALEAVKADWKYKPQGGDTTTLFGYLKAQSENTGASREREETGSVGKGLEGAAHTLDQTYNIAYIAHAPLEPRAAVAEWSATDGKLTVWTGSQRPFAIRDELSSEFRIPKDHVRVIVPDTGSAYGGKHTGDAALEAARLARAAGKPVKIVWTREEEFTWAYFRPAGVIHIKSAISAEGTLTAWEFHNHNSGGSGIATPYVVANKVIEYHPAESPLRQGSYRGLAATANHFARESHMDELAHLARLDPLEFRLKNLSDERLRAVFEAAARAFGWPGTKTTAGQGFGIGGGVEKNGYVATCAEVAVDRGSGNVRVVRVVTAFECGAIVNPDGLRHQIIGANIMGLGGALFEAIEFSNGTIKNPHFSIYRVPRFRDIPDIEAVLVDRKDIPSAGAGETPIVGLAPAIGNAIFDATSIRLRNLPLVPQGLKS
jgi:CO/xanthine dehydrogenase Mo-binding subunit